MKPRFLFPTYFKALGLILLLSGIVFFVLTQQGYLNGLFIWENFRSEFTSIQGPGENFSDEIQLTLITLGLLFIAFSKEKIEDEQINQLRLESLQWSVYINYAVFFILIFTQYGLGFLMDVLYNVLTLLVFFILRFRWAIYSNNKLMEEDDIS